MKSTTEPAELPPADKADELPADLAQILPGLPPETRKIVVRALSVAEVAGPIPCAEQMASYEPDVRAKILEWADVQMHHRMDMERRQVTGAEWRMNLGQWITGATALSSIGVAAYVMIVGGVTTGAVAGGIGIMAIGVGGPSVAAAFAEVIARYLEREPSAPPETTPQRKKPPKRR